MVFPLFTKKYIYSYVNSTVLPRMFDSIECWSSNFWRE